MLPVVDAAAATAVVVAGAAVELVVPAIVALAADVLLPPPVPLSVALLGNVSLLKNISRLLCNCNETHKKEEDGLKSRCKSQRAGAGRVESRKVSLGAYTETY